MSQPASHPFGYEIEPRRSVRGTGIAWDHEVQIALPRGYGDSDVSYPVLWVTDGVWAFEVVLAMLALSRETRLPEMIVVGVGVAAADSNEAHRRRFWDFTPTGSLAFGGVGSALYEPERAALEREVVDLGMSPMGPLGGAEFFLGLLVDELRPALAREYRMSDDHTLIGHSMGGLFCTYAFLSRTSAFRRYLSASPCLNYCDQEIFRIEERVAGASNDLPATLFLGAGEAEATQGGVVSAAGIVSSTARLAEILRLRAYPSLDLRLRLFPGDDHGTIVPAFLTAGFQALWSSRS